MTTIDEYVATQPVEMQRILEEVRAAVRRAVPSALETISYKMPAFKLHGKVLLYFAAWKSHYSIYPAGSRAVQAGFKKDLARYEVDKGTIRFPNAEPVPVDLIVRIAAFRAEEIEKAASLRTKARR